MNEIKQKEIYLVSFPFSDLSSNKVRPVLILSNNKYNKTSEDVVICAITRNLNSIYGIKINNSDISEGVILESMIKVENICFIDKKLFIKKIAVLSDKKFIDVKNKLSEII